MSAFTEEFAAAAMPDMLAHFGDEVVYSRGQQTVKLTAIGTAVTFDVVQAGEIQITAQRMDWLLRRQDLVLDGLATDPIEGDRITDGTRIYEVMPVGTESAAGPADVDADLWNIHTRLVEVSDA